MKNIYLISSLGLSPGVVTGVIDSLQYDDLKERYNPKYIAVITTDNELTRLSLEVIEKDVGKYNPHIVIIPYIMNGLSDISTRKDNERVMQAFVDAVKEGERFRARGEIDEIHVNIAGGRKTMSGVFTSLSNIFPVEKVYHLLTTPEMEQKGHIKNFLTPEGTIDTEKINSGELRVNLHPKVANAPSTLVEIPILHNFNFENLLRLTRELEKQKAISESDLVKIMVKEKFLLRVGEGKDSFIFTEKGRQLFNLFQHYISN